MTSMMKRKMISQKRYKAVFQSLAIGDSFGAEYEGGIAERFLWRLIGTTRDGKKRYTDDTQMSIDVARSLLKSNGVNQDHLAQTFASSYRWSRGYGPSAAKLLKGIQQGKKWQSLNRKKFKEGSMGNGAAMRAPIVALFHPIDDENLYRYIQQSAEITHAHPIAIEGARIIATSVCMALKDASNENILKSLITNCHITVYQTKLDQCVDFIQATHSPDLKTLKKQLGNGILASESCVTAVYFGLKYRELTLKKC